MQSNPGVSIPVGSPFRPQPSLVRGDFWFSFAAIGKMGYPAGEDMGTEIVELEDIRNSIAASGFWQAWDSEQDTLWRDNLIIARDLPTNKQFLEQEPEVYLLRLVALSGQVMGTFGVYGNLLVWKLYLCVERILLVQSQHFSLARGEALLPRNEKYVAAYLWNKKKGIFMDLNVIFHPQETCRWCMRASEDATWDCQGVQIRVPIKCPCGLVTDVGRPWRSWVHMTCRLAQQHRVALARHLDPIDQRSLTGADW